MNFAFPALLVFVLILPGIILRYSYCRGTWGWASPTSIRGVSEELAFGIMLSLPLHFIWSQVCTLCGFKPDIVVLLRLLTNAESITESDLLGVSASSFYIVCYFTSLFLVASIIGASSHHLVRKWGWDRKVKALRFDNYWFYMLTGEVYRFKEWESDARPPDGVYVSVVVNLDSGSYLYRGIIVDFNYDKNGQLETIVLIDAHRRALKGDRKPGLPHDPDNLPDDPRYYRINGDYFLISYSDICTMNFDLFWLTDYQEGEPEGEDDEEEDELADDEERTIGQPSMHGVEPGLSD